MTSFSNETGTEDISLDFSPEELQEFLEADQIEVHADPEFKERLREKLWDYLRKRYQDKSRES